MWKAHHFNVISIKLCQIDFPITSKRSGLLKSVALTHACIGPYNYFDLLQLCTKMTRIKLISDERGEAWRRVKKMQGKRDISMKWQRQMSVCRRSQTDLSCLTRGNENSEIKSSAELNYTNKRDALKVDHKIVGNTRWFKVTLSTHKFLNSHISKCKAV